MGTFMLCSEASLVNYGERQVRAVTLWCKCWTCDLCFSMRKARLVRELAEGEPNAFLTLTTRVVEGRCPVQEARFQGACLGALIRKIKKRWPDYPFAYFAVREATKRGWPHLHVVMRAPFLPWTWLMDEWEALSGSRGIDIKKIYRAGKTAKYLAKYVGKDPHRFGTTKRYWYSRNWFDLKPEPEPPAGDWDSRWHIVEEEVHRLAERYKIKRWTFTLTGRFDYFEARSPTWGR